MAILEMNATYIDGDDNAIPVDIIFTKYSADVPKTKQGFVPISQVEYGTNLLDLAGYVSDSVGLTYELANGSKMILYKNPETRDFSFIFYGPDGLEIPEMRTFGVYATGNNVFYGLGAQDYGVNADVFSLFYDDGRGTSSGIRVGNKTNFTRTRNFFDGDVLIYEADVNMGDTSGSGGGYGGSFNKSTDPVDFADLPSGANACNSGLVTMYNPTPAQMTSFGNFLWGSLFEGTFDGLLTSLKKWVNDPVESIIQLNCYPLTNIPTSGAQTVKFCGISTDLVGDGVIMNKVSQQFINFDFGSITTPVFWDSALDYSPYTKVSISLPYIGIVPLNADDVINATLHLMYHIDILTGSFSAELKVSKAVDGTELSSVLYNWSGNMATQIPITAANYNQVFGSLMSTVAAIGVGAVTGGLGAAAAGEGVGASAIAGGAVSGAGQGLAANIGNVVNSKPHVTKSGRLDGTIGAMSQFTPYLIIERAIQSLSSKYQEENGLQSNTVQTLGNCRGLTVCENPILTGFVCTEAEKNEIKAILTSGVIM